MVTSFKLTYHSAFNAIISASVVALGVSYAIPPAINCLRGRKMLPPRPFVLPGPLGWMCNLLGIAYVIVTTVLFLFPPTLPVTGSNMSTSSIVFPSFKSCSSPLWVVTRPIRPTSIFSCYDPPRLTSSFLYSQRFPLSPFPPQLFLLHMSTLLVHSLTIFSDYCVVAFFIVVVISVVQWFVDGRKNYKGPVVELIGEDEVVYAGDNVDDKTRGADGVENGEAPELQGNGAME